jgi:DNA/RNA endonuclease G (NUC1)
MHELAARALSLAHETFRCGVPHFRERRIIPIRTSAHLIIFDAARISPLYTMLEVNPTDVTDVKREDNFSSGDISLPDELSTTEKHYSNWNKAHPEFPVDKGHSAGSQYRRGDVVEQSDVDTLAGVTPEASKTNRNVKGPLESAILAQAKKKTHTYLVQGPVWYGLEPINGKLENGQWIPDALFISAMFLHNKTAKSWTFLMENSKTIKGANLREIKLNDLERLTGLYVWGNVRINDFKKRRDKLSRGTWWLAGQSKSKSSKSTTKASSKKKAKASTKKKAKK